MEKKSSVRKFMAIIFINGYFLVIFLLIFLLLIDKFGLDYLMDSNLSNDINIICSAEVVVNDQLLNWRCKGIQDNYAMTETFFYVKKYPYFLTLLITIMFYIGYVVEEIKRQKKDSNDS